MAPKNYGKCAGCHNAIQNKEFLACSACKLKYDIECAGISPNRFHSFYALDQDRKNKWTCPECCSKVRKTDNTNTPINRPRPELSSITVASDTDCHKIQSENVTLRSTKPTQASMTRNVDSAALETVSGNCTITEEKLRVILKKELTEMQYTIKNAVTEQINNILTQFGDLRESMTFFNKQYEDLKEQLEAKTELITYLQSDNENLKSTVRDLSSRLSSVEQNMRSCNVELNGIPESKAENLNNTFSQLVQIIGAPIAADEIVQVTRVAKISNDSNRPRAVIAKLRSPKHRDIVLAAVSNFNKKNPEDKLSSKHLGHGGPCKPVFVAEHLSPPNKLLHATARRKAKENDYKFTWVRNGRIFVRKTEFSESILIRNTDSLNLIK